MKLEKLKQSRDKIKNLLNTQDEFSKHFHGGRVGFKSGAAQKKWQRGIDKELDLMRELMLLNEKIDRLENPLVRSKSTPIEPATFNVGDKVWHLGCKVEVVKINKKTVTIQYENSDFREAIKPHLID